MLIWGIVVAPFEWDIDWIIRDPVPVDAIPDIGEKQQIVFTKWMGRSPQDIEDQVTYPLTVALLGIPEVKTVRSCFYRRICRGRPFRQWRAHIKKADDIWDEIVKKARIIGVTSAPKLQPIAARIVMLQIGMPYESVIPENSRSWQWC